MQKVRLPQQVFKGQLAVPLAAFFKPNTPQIIALRKNEAFEQKLLKKLAQDNNLIIWCFYFDNPQVNMKVQLISISGVIPKQDQQETVNDTLEKVAEINKQLRTIFPMIYQYPTWAIIGKFFEFNAYGMHDLPNQHECEICFVPLKELNTRLNCCGKSVCNDCSSAYIKQKKICPFCRQKGLCKVTIPELLQMKARQDAQMKLDQE